jgi:hypothetical protein
MIIWASRTVHDSMMAIFSTTFTGLESAPDAPSGAAGGLDGLRLVFGDDLRHRPCPAHRCGVSQPVARCGPQRDPPEVVTGAQVLDRLSDPGRRR